MSLLAGAFSMLRRVEPIRVTGSVAALRGLTLLVDDLPIIVGALVSVHTSGGEVRLGEVVGFEGRRTIVMILGTTAGVRAGDRVMAEQSSPTISVGDRLLGRVIDGLGRPIDGLAPASRLVPCPLSPDPIAAMRRRRIDTMLTTGVRAIDLMTTVGKGQRLGVFAGPGVGKSTLLSMISRRSAADVNIIALIGERGREVREFVEEALGVEGLRRSIVVVSTSDESPLLRVRAAMVACAAAEHFRDRGLDVTLMLDSLTRFAHAQRQIGLAVGEPPATKGYTPSVFAALPALLERAGAVDPSDDSIDRATPAPTGNEGAEGMGSGSRGRSGGGVGGVGGRGGGSITGFYTILVEGDDTTEPISDAARGILDGHVMLTRSLANKAHFPAIDILDSISRVAAIVSDPDHSAARQQVVRLMAAYREVEDLIQIGAYASGSNPITDAAIALKPRIDALLQQRVTDDEPFTTSRAALLQIARDAERLIGAASSRNAPRPQPQPSSAPQTKPARRSV